MSWACHYTNGLVCVTHATWEVGSHIVGVVKPSTTNFDNLDTNKGLVVDVTLLEKVLTIPIFTVKSITLRVHLDFS